MADSKDQNNNHLPYAVVPLIAIVGGAAAVMLCWVFYRHLNDAPPEQPPMTDEQAEYMREVSIPRAKRRVWWVKQSC